MGQILLVRHGQASFGASNYDQLSERGQAQARLLGQWFAQRGQRFDQVVSGTMVRHRQTAQACIGALADAPAADAWQEDAGFNEYDHDAVLHCYRPEFAQPGEVRRFIAATGNGNRVFQQIFEDAMARWMSGVHDAEYREPWPVFRQRCIAALTRLVQASGGSQTAVVFTSGGTIATLCQHVLRMPDPQMFALNWTLVNSAVTKLYHRATPGTPAEGNDGAQPRILSLGYLNNYAHLEVTDDAQAITYR
jgi:broad specificity phosphatase PhoE